MFRFGHQVSYPLLCIKIKPRPHNLIIAFFEN
ncbi:hypothetical protein M8C21_012416 [Ambrosia artemisiifolia]|uniref:Uncharacterized protein n=1 Tax=Ambrosia artemisiifolia TaxID=4212 RepID=A0AAD5GQA6_AMBAR|nr:hypothetical protein M8C21_012416 [Ambrosia artemisiifolia]